MIIGALILTVIGLGLAIMAGYLSADNLSPLTSFLAVLATVCIVVALALSHGTGSSKSLTTPVINKEVGK